MNWRRRPAPLIRDEHHSRPQLPLKCHQLASSTVQVQLSPAETHIQPALPKPHPQPAPLTPPGGSCEAAVATSSSPPEGGSGASGGLGWRYCSDCCSWLCTSSCWINSSRYRADQRGVKGPRFSCTVFDLRVRWTRNQNISSRKGWQHSRTSQAPVRALSGSFKPNTAQKCRNTTEPVVAC